MVETSVAVSGNHAVLAVIKQTVPGPIAVFSSDDAGTTWSRAQEMPLSAGGKTYPYAWDPWVVVLDDGSFALSYVVTSGLAGSGQNVGDCALVYARSTDGVTWSSPVVIASGAAGLVAYIDKPTLTADRVRGILYVVCSRVTGPASNLVIASSTDRGATWSAMQPVTSVESIGQLAVTSDGTLVFTSYNANSRSYQSRFSTDGGRTFSTPQAIGSGHSFTTPGTGTFTMPIQNVVAFGGDVYCVFPATAGVFFTRSRDAGKTWSSPLQLGGASGDAVFPSVAVDDSGSIVVSWLDGRDNPSGGTLRLYASESTDGGASFSTPRPFSSPFPAGGAMGDYNSTVMIRSGVALTAFSTAGGYLTAARLNFTSRRRAVSH